MDTRSPFAEGRAPHWLKPNHASRSPHRWIVIDSETHRQRDARGEVQTFRLAVGQRWTDEGRVIRHEEQRVADTPEELWEWVSDFTRRGKRTVLWAHNLDFDLQVTRAFDILPQLGWDLEWSNLDAQVSMVTWRRDGRTLAMTDTYTWCPRPLQELGTLVRIAKPDLPDDDDGRQAWVTRCTADVEITTQVVRTLIDHVRDGDLGNMQLSGAGMGHSMWRHKYLDHKILVHADASAIEAERTAMHTGRAEAWRHGVYNGQALYEWDLRNAYTRIARDDDLPYKLIGYRDNPPQDWLDGWWDKWRVLAKCRVRTETPVVPAVHEERRIWPVGEFETVLWDCEIDCARGEGAEVEILGVWCYLKAPIMRRWAEHTLRVLDNDPDDIPAVVKIWYKHQARATIGRCGMRYTNWLPAGPDWIGLTGFSIATDTHDGRTFRQLHLAGKLWEEDSRTEGRDSLPQVPSWIAARCRVTLWQTMRYIGLQDVWYVDTDSVLVDDVGHARMLRLNDERPQLGWRVKGIHRYAEIHGPRQIILDQVPRIAGMPKRARRTGPDTWEGEVWQRMGGALERGDITQARVLDQRWSMTWDDRRRTHLAHGRTEAVRLPNVAG
jgi:hypothetical protein